MQQYLAITSEAQEQMLKLRYSRTWLSLTSLSSAHFSWTLCFSFYTQVFSLSHCSKLQPLWPCKKISTGKELSPSSHKMMRCVFNPCLSPSNATVKLIPLNFMLIYNNTLMHSVFTPLRKTSKVAKAPWCFFCSLKKLSHWWHCCINFTCNQMKKRNIDKSIANK